MPLKVARTFDERALFLSDVHFPFQDDIALDVAMQFAKFWKPTHLFLMGDMIDCYSISRFDKDPRRRIDLQTEADETHAGLFELRRIVGKDCIIHYVEGNHEFRLTKYLYSRAPELAFIRCFDMESLLGLKLLNIRYVPSGTMRYHGFIVKHGHIVRKRSGYTAHGELEKNGISGASGHTHRLGMVYKRDYSGMYTWIETGCLCKLDPEYGEGQVMDWTHGFAYGMFRHNDNRFLVQTLPIVKGSVVFGETEIVTEKVLPPVKKQQDIEYL